MKCVFCSVKFGQSKYSLLRNVIGIIKKLIQSLKFCVIVIFGMILFTFREILVQITVFSSKILVQIFFYLTKLCSFVLLIEGIQ